MHTLLLIVAWFALVACLVSVVTVVLLVRWSKRKPVITADEPDRRVEP